MDAKDQGAGRLSAFRSRKGKCISNAVPFAVDTLPECLEQEPNNDRPTPSRSRCRSSSTGASISRATGTCSASRAAPAQEIVAEVYARRLDSPLDSVLKLTDAAGRQLAFNDDHEDKGVGLDHAPRRFLAHGHAARRRHLLSALGDAQHKGGAEYAYRLRISEPRPDFELRVVPSSVNVRAGASRADHRLCPAERRFRRRDRAGPEGRRRRDSA